jgi:hypothetical protein
LRELPAGENAEADRGHPGSVIIVKIPGIVKDRWRDSTLFPSR